MEEKIRLYMEDWLYNSGLVGLYNILNYSEDKVTVDDNFIEFELEQLRNFEKKVF